MTATGHAILGTVIAAKIGNPALAVPIALASHVVADLIPHWDVATNGSKKDRKKVFKNSFIDVIVGFIISYLLLNFLFPQTNLIYALFIILVSQSFDWIMAIYYFFNIKIFKFMYDFQKLFDNELNKPWGIITQVTFVLLAILLAKIF